MLEAQKTAPQQVVGGRGPGVYAAGAVQDKGRLIHGIENASAERERAALQRLTRSDGGPDVRRGHFEQPPFPFLDVPLPPPPGNAKTDAAVGALRKVGQADKWNVDAVDEGPIFAMAAAVRLGRERAFVEHLQFSRAQADADARVDGQIAASGGREIFEDPIVCTAVVVERSRPEADQLGYVSAREISQHLQGGRPLVRVGRGLLKTQ